MQRALALAAIAMLAACRAGIDTSRPAADGVRALVVALRSDNPRQAYDLMSSHARSGVRYDDFALRWKQTGPEREWQARVLEDSLRGDPDVGERAQIDFADGKVVQLQREGKSWRLESALVSRSRARRSRDAVKLFAEAVGRRDVGAILGVLTARRRDGIARQVEGFLSGLQKHINDRIEESGTDQAVLRWDEAGIRYKIVLRREDDEWRVDDISIRTEADSADDEAPREESAPDID